MKDHELRYLHCFLAVAEALLTPLLRNTRSRRCRGPSMRRRTERVGFQAGRQARNEWPTVMHQLIVQHVIGHPVGGDAGT